MNPTLLHWLYAREMLRRLGFLPEEIFFTVSPSGRLLDVNLGIIDLNYPIIAVEIRRGDLRFVWTIGTIEMPADQIEAAYQAACSAWNHGGVATDEEFFASEPMRQAVPLLMALRAKGFVIEQLPHLGAQ